VAEDLDQRIRAEMKLLIDKQRTIKGHLLKHPRQALKVAQLMRQAPQQVYMPGTGVEAAGVLGQLRENFSTRRLTFGFYAVLPIPADGASFTKGSSMGTLRRKARKATNAGITWRRITEPAEKQALLERARRHEQETAREQYRNPEADNAELVDYDLWLVAEKADGQPVFVTVIPVDGEWAALRYFRTLEVSEEASNARYLMTQVLVEHLSDLGVRYLVDPAIPHCLSAGLREFQMMSGYSHMRIRIPARGVYVSVQFNERALGEAAAVEAPSIKPAPSMADVLRS
jgi:hypothetical protein